MILKGKCNISKVTVSDPHYDSKVKCRLSKILPKEYEWNVEIHLKEGEDELFGHVTKLLDASVYIERVEEDPRMLTFIDKQNGKFSYLQGLKVVTQPISVDTATIMINDVEILTRADGNYGGYHVLTNSKHYKNYHRGLVGIHFILLLHGDCICESGYDLMNVQDVKKMFEHVFKTELEVVKEDNHE